MAARKKENTKSRKRANTEKTNRDNGARQPKADTGRIRHRESLDPDLVRVLFTFRTLPEDKATVAAEAKRKGCTQTDVMHTALAYYFSLPKATRDKM